METVSKAIIFAVEAHDGMRRKQSESPYILHPMEAAVIAGSLTDDQDVIAAAVLHDAVEDAKVPIEEINRRFGKRVAELVLSETEDKREYLPKESTWKLRKEEAIQLLKDTKDTDIKIIYLGDKLANMRSIYHTWKQEGRDMWKQFNQQDPAEHAWYYRSISENLSELADTPAYQEFNELIHKVFKEV